MTCRRELLVAILVYVALDLSLPTMPGAFAFEPADSVESVGGGRLATRVVIVPTPAGAGPFLMVFHLDRDLRHRLPPCSEVVVLGCPPTHRLPRGTCHPSRASEDPA